MAFSRDEARALLERCFEQGRMAHAYLISGPAGSGKTALALDLIELLSGRRCESLEAARSEMIQVVRPESKSRRIRVDAIRAMERRLYLAVPAGVTKIGVILDADRMMPEAANAFLKTLEEPPDQSVLLLLTAAPEQLLDTTRSRCIALPLRRAQRPGLGDTEARLLDFLAGHFGGGEASGRSFAWTLMQRFSALLKEEKEAVTARYAEVFKAEREHYAKFTEGDWLKRREEALKALTEADYLERRNALIQLLMDWFGDALRLQAGSDRLDLTGHRAATEALARAVPRAELMRRFEALEAMRSHLATNVSEPLALECGFLRAFG